MGIKKSYRNGISYYIRKIIINECNLRDSTIKGLEWIINCWIRKSILTIKIQLKLKYKKYLY